MPRQLDRTTSSRRRPAIAALALIIAATMGVGAPAMGQCEPMRVVSPRGEEAFRFARSVALNAREGGNQLAIGEPPRVWTYEMIDGDLQQRQELFWPYPVSGSQFGVSIAMDARRLVVGAHYIDWPERDFDVGGAAVYDWTGEQWVHSGDLEPPKRVAGTGTGSIVAVDGEVILAGGGPGGRIIVYTPAPAAPDGWTWTQVIEAPLDLPRDAAFGFPFVASDGWLFVGASRDDTTGYLAGSVFVYRRGPENNYVLVQKIEGSTAAPFAMNLFGEGLAFDGRTLVIGTQWAAPRFERQGVAFVYALEGSLWTQRQTITHRGARAYDQFGPVISVDDDRMLVTAWRDRTERSDATVYAFERDANDTWRQSARVLPTPPYYASRYGAPLVLAGDVAIIGATEESAGPRRAQTGAAYLFNLSCYECPDLDADDHLTVFDYLEFMRAFDAGEPIADFDNDGQFTIADYLAFQHAFEVGCP